MEYAVHHLGDYGVSVGFEGLGSPLGCRNGKVVQRKGKPIISSVNRGDSREAGPSIFGDESGVGKEPVTAKSFNSIPRPCSIFLCILFPVGEPGFFSSRAIGVGSIPTTIFATSSSKFALFLLAIAGLFKSVSTLFALGVGNIPLPANADRLDHICEFGL